MTTDGLESLRSRWSTLYSRTLPDLARAKDAAQQKWPVTLDHCFARIILDNTVGNGTQQWDSVIKRPAVRNMDRSQLEQAIELGERIRHGKIDLVELDKKSLSARGKSEKKYKDDVKRAREDANDDDQKKPVSKRIKVKPDRKQSTLPFAKPSSKVETMRDHPSLKPPTDASPSPDRKTNNQRTSFPNPHTPDLLLKIQNHASLTPYRKRLYSTLLSVPPGLHTTYQAMATYLNSSARAIGNGMRNNPYAPDVPCHRVLASDGSIGGFGGSWGEEGEHAGKKRDLLKSEGVYFDSRGRVRGPVFRDFEDLSERTSP